MATVISLRVRMKIIVTFLNGHPKTHLMISDYLHVSDSSHTRIALSIDDANRPAALFQSRRSFDS
ncbi:hypothetical protein [Pseudomonas glycinae]|uniref:Uncharacterized protein n=1 Tax=Pseudomonas glycinae TaxID=1785145 RepID=A0ABM6QID5_9PSED|nr:hypothetical protein [Pseudomonas glycinae]AUG97622.1 hypothetical protein AWU82_29870 [Pseudomonas glycinae]